MSSFKEDDFFNLFPDGIERHFWHYARNCIVLHHVRDLPGKVLDVGAGRGVVTSFLYENGVDVLGVEPGMTTPLRNAPILYGKDSFSLPDEIRNEVRTILLLDVIEHIKNPVDFLRDIHSYFPELLWIFITVPARYELWSNFDEHYGHIKRYTPEILFDELKEANFQVEMWSYFFHMLYPVIFITNLLIRRRSLRFRAPKGISVFLHLLLGKYFFFEYFFVPRWVPGSSLLCLAKPIR